MEIVTVSKIRCPQCGFVNKEDLPENSCHWFSTCLGCGTLFRPIEKESCNFFSFRKCRIAQTLNIDSRIEARYREQVI